MRVAQYFLMSILREHYQCTPQIPLECVVIYYDKSNKNHNEENKNGGGDDDDDDDVDDDSKGCELACSMLQYVLQRLFATSMSSSFTNKEEKTDNIHREETSMFPQACLLPVRTVAFHFCLEKRKSSSSLVSASGLPSSFVLPLFWKYLSPQQQIRSAFHFGNFDIELRRYGICSTFTKNKAVLSCTTMLEAEHHQRWLQKLQRKEGEKPRSNVEGVIETTADPLWALSTPTIGHALDHFARGTGAAKVTTTSDKHSNSTIANEVPFLGRSSTSTLTPESAADAHSTKENVIPTEKGMCDGMVERLGTTIFCKILY
jgi:hypothetical protein